MCKFNSSVRQVRTSEVVTITKYCCPSLESDTVEAVLPTNGEDDTDSGNKNNRLVHTTKHVANVYQANQITFLYHHFNCPLL